MKLLRNETYILARYNSGCACRNRMDLDIWNYVVDKVKGTVMRDTRNQIRHKTRSQIASDITVRKLHGVLFLL